MSIVHLPLFEDVDVIQVGARNMQNFDLLQGAGQDPQAHPAQARPCQHPEGAADERRVHHGQRQRAASSSASGASAPLTTYTRNTLDLAAVPMLHELTHLPVIVDPSHATGINRLVAPMAMAATACGADGLIIEVHNDPIHALCDGAQSLRPGAVRRPAWARSAQIRKVGDGMTVGIVGLGLIGGSFAKAYHEAGHRVLAFDTDRVRLRLCRCFPARWTVL